MSNTVYLCSAKRTAIGSFQGVFSGVSASDLGACVLKAVLEDSGLAGEVIDEVILGCVLTAGTGQAPARQAQLAAGLPQRVQAMTINKVCSSGLKAVMLAADAVSMGRAEAVLAGGMENMSRAPYLLPTMRLGARLGHASAVDSILSDALWDVYNDFHMGNAAELCAKKFSLSREQQDSFAIESYRRANEAIAQGLFREEISPMVLVEKKSERIVEEDEEPLRAKPEKIPVLKPVFAVDGTITAANASSINDGAAAMLVCSERFVVQHQLKPMARVVAQGCHAQAPEWFTTAPVGAVANALAEAGWRQTDVDLFEINEAFSAVALACGQELEIEASKLNVCGGAVALGHPVGASGARILTTLLYALKRAEASKGVVGICNGGGEATALAVERV